AISPKCKGFQHRGHGEHGENGIQVLRRGGLPIETSSLDLCRQTLQHSDMALEFTTSYLKDATDLFRYYKRLGDRAMEQVPDDALFATLDVESNSIAVIVNHLAGNMRSRWTDFLTTDGEKPGRNRDAEFETPPKARAELMALWDS